MQTPERSLEAFLNEEICRLTDDARELEIMLKPLGLGADWGVGRCGHQSEDWVLRGRESRTKTKSPKIIFYSKSCKMHRRKLTSIILILIIGGHHRMAEFSKLFPSATCVRHWTYFNVI